MTIGPKLELLLLEDNPVDAAIIGAHIEKFLGNVSITRVDNEEDFRTAMTRTDLDVILSDYDMPEFDGLSALRIAREFTKDLPFIFVSGGLGEERATQALRDGATDYVVKDRLARLPAAIERAVVERRKREELRRAEDALRRSEERFRYAVQAEQEVIWDFDLRSKTVSFEVNEALRSLWGWDLPASSFPMEWWSERIHPDDREAVQASFVEAIAKGVTWASECRFQRGDGSYGYADHRAVIVRDASGNPLRVICATLDVTERRLIEERLRESESRFRSVTETALDGIVVLDEAFRIVYWNHGAERLFGYDAGNRIVGQQFTVLIPEPSRATHAYHLAQFVSAEAGALPSRIALLNGLRADGTEVPIEISISSWRTRDGLFCTIIMRDVTERVQVEQRQRIQYSVTRTLVDSDSVDAAVRCLLRTLGEELGCKVGFFWTVDYDGEVFRNDGLWRAEDFAGDEFVALSRRLTFRKGVFLIGKVWEEKRTIVVDEIADAHEYIRGKVAGRAGIQRVLAFPVVERGVVTGIFELCQAVVQPVLHSHELRQLMTDIGTRVGEFLQRRRAEEKLHENEQMLANAVTVARLGSWSLDVDTGRLQFSDLAYEVFGIRQDAFDGTLRSYLNRVHPGDRELVKRLMTVPLAHESLAIHHRLIGDDGAIRTIHGRAWVVAGTLDKPVRLIGTVQDVTDQLEQQEYVRRLSHQNRLILESAAEAILGFDLNLKTTFANPAATVMTGWSLEELLDPNFTIHELIHHSQPDRAFFNDGVRSGEETFYRRSGEKFTARYSVSPIHEDGRIVGMVMTLQDVTEQKQLERQLEQSKRINSLGRVATTIAHEFNNVLMGIQPFADTIRRRVNSDEKVVASAEQILNSVARGKQLTQQILGFTKSAEPYLEPLRLDEWLRRIVPELRELAGRSVDINVQLPSTEAVVRADEVQMQQVITNLVLNARDAMPGGGGKLWIAIEVTSEPKTFSFGTVAAGMAILSVRDTGKGIPADVLPNIFEPLFTTKRSGTGLGLAVAQQVIVRSGGSIDVESTPGQGTTFYIALPEISVPRAGNVV